MPKNDILNMADWARYVEAMNNKLQMKFKSFEIQTKEIKDSVSRAQQSYLYSTIYPRLKEGLIHAGYDIRSLEEDEFDYFMREMFYYKVVKTSKGEKKIPKRLCFTKGKKDEVSLYITDLLNFASRLGVYIPSSSGTDFIV